MGSITKIGGIVVSVIGYLQALNNLIARSTLIYEELKYERECEKKESEKDSENTSEE